MGLSIPKGLFLSLAVAISVSGNSALACHNSSLQTSDSLKEAKTSEDIERLLYRLTENVSSCSDEELKELNSDKSFMAAVLAIYVNRLASDTASDQTLHLIDKLGGLQALGWHKCGHAYCGN